MVISFSSFYNSVRLCCLLDFSLTKKLLGNQTVPSNFDLSSGWWYYFSHPKKSPVPYCAASVIYHQNWPSIFFSLATFNQLNFWLWSFGPQEFYVSCKRTPNIISDETLRLFYRLWRVARRSISRKVYSLFIPMLFLITLL